MPDDLVELEPARAIVVRSPFSLRRDFYEVMPGETVSQVFALAGLDHSVPARVFLDGELVAPTDYSITIAQSGSLLSIRVIPGRDPNKTGGLLVQLPALGAGLATLPFGGALVAGLVYAGVSMVGMLVTNALVPPSAPSEAKLT